MRLSLPNSKKIRALARVMGCHRCEALGCCMAFWAWAQEQTEDGRIEGLTKIDVDDVVGRSGFAAAMVAIEWLTIDEAGVVIPRWDENNSNGAKARAKAAERMARVRNQAQHSANICATSAQPKSHHRTEQQSREENRTEEQQTAMSAADSDLPEALCSMLIALTAGGVRVFDPAAAAAIAQNPRCSRLKVLWALERTQASIRRGKRPTNVAGFVRDLIENREIPPGWVESRRRKDLAAMASKGAAA